MVGRHQEETRAGFETARQETRALGVTVESLRHEIRRVAEGVVEANRRIDENTRTLEDHGRRLDAHGLRLEHHGRRLDANTHAIEGQTSRIDVLTDRIGRREASV